jgi:predicted nuclease of predicted toxin-antitoxin system
MPSSSPAVVRESRMLITLDRGFGDIRRYPPGTHAGIAVMRCADQSTAAVERALTDLLNAHELDEFVRCTVIVQAGGIRVRRE